MTQKTMRQVQRTCWGLILLLSGTVVNAQDHLHHGASGLPHGIPDFCQAAGSVIVPTGTQAVWSGTLTAPCLGVHGTVRVADGTTITGTVMVYDDGALLVGTPSTPAQNVTFVFPDVALDLTSDPEQFGNGLIVFGTLKVYGDVKTPFVRLASEVQPGVTVLDLAAAPSGWQPGDRLALVGQPEEVVTIAAISGRSVVLRQPTTSAHLGIRSPEGELAYLPHIANLTRSVVFKSVNPQGTRGHSLYSGRADIAIQGAAFVGMGRTRAEALVNSTTYGDDNAPNHIGTNQIGRYAVHFHHTLGPVYDGRADQYRFIGNVLEANAKVGLAVHNTHYGLVQDNVVFGAGGAGMWTEDGSETGNKFIHNLVAAVYNPTIELAPSEETYDPQARKGSGLWLASINSEVRNNVIAGVQSEGITFYSGCSEDAGDPCAPTFIVPVPIGPGLDPSLPENRLMITNTGGSLLYPSRGQRDPLPVDGNEIYSAKGVAFSNWWVARAEISTPLGGAGVISNTTVWNSSVCVLFRYADAIFDGLECLNEGGVGQAINQMNDASSLGLGVVASEIHHFSFRGYDQSYVKTGQLAHAPLFVFQDGLSQTRSGFQITNEGQGTPIWPLNGRDLEVHRYEWINVLHTPLPGLPLRAIEATYRDGSSNDNIEGWRYFELNVRGYQQEPTQNFRIFFAQQAPAAPAPAPGGVMFPGVYDDRIAGCPEPGLSNQECWTKYGIATLMALAPCQNSLPGIEGFTCTGEVPPPPLVTHATPTPTPAPAPTPTPLAITPLAPIAAVSVDGNAVAVSYTLPFTTGGVAPVSVACDPPSGSLFQAGVTPVTCIATDAAQQRASTLSVVTVTYTPPPALTISALQAMNAVSLDGRPVAFIYPTPVTTGGLAPVFIVCTPPSGSFFTVGTTAVMCTATDAVGQTALTLSFVTVTYTPPPPMTLPTLSWLCRTLSVNSYLDGTKKAVFSCPQTFSLDQGDTATVTRTTSSWLCRLAETVNAYSDDTYTVVFRCPPTFSVRKGIVVTVSK